MSQEHNYIVSDTQHWCMNRGVWESLNPSSISGEYLMLYTAIFWSSQLHNKALNRFRVGGRGTVCLSLIVLGDYIIHILNDEMHMGRNVRDRKDCLFFSYSTR